MKTLDTNVLIAVGIFLAAFIIAAVTLDNQGITWDEPASYFAGVQQIEAWKQAVVATCRQGNWPAIFSREFTAQYFPPPTEKTQKRNFFNNHPPIPRYTGYVTWSLFRDWVGETPAMRLAAVFFYALLVAVIFLMGALQSRAVGLTATLFTLTQPQLFGFSHFLTTEIFLTSFWVIVGYLFLRGFNSSSPVRWYIAGWLVFGLAVNVKFTALIIPAPLLIYLLLRKRDHLIRFLSWAPLGGLTAYLTNPTWWHDPLATFYQHHLLLSLSRTSFFNPASFYWGRLWLNAPWHYPLVLTLITVPVIILGFFFLSLISLTASSRRPSLTLFSLINLISILIIVSLPGAPKYDMVRLFLPIFPWLALMAAEAAVTVIKRLFYTLKNLSSARWAYAIISLMVTMAVYHQIRETVSYRAFPLSYYNELIGGLPGAYARGMEATYWMEAMTPSFVAEFNRTIPLGDSLTIYPQNPDVIKYYQKIGVLHSDIRIVPEGKNPSFAVWINRRSANSERSFKRLQYEGYRMLDVVNFKGVPLTALFYRGGAKQKP